MWLSVNQGCNNPKFLGSTNSINLNIFLKETRLRCSLKICEIREIRESFGHKFQEKQVDFVEKSC